MEIGTGKVKGLIHEMRNWLKERFVKTTSFSKKAELKISSFKWMGVVFIFVFICVVLLMPTEVPVQFTEKMETKPPASMASGKSRAQQNTPGSSQLWASPRREYFPRGAGGGGPEVNHNTSMLIGSSGGNAKTQLRSGTRLPLRILDKVMVSQESVPVLAELLLDGMTDSGLRLPAGTKFYGEANFEKGSERATVVFKQISLPSGQIKGLAARAVGKDGQLGVLGRVYSEGAKNTAGQVLTTFVGGLAAGSMQTDVFGRSKGGLENGLLSAVAETARSKAQSYGESLKSEREWLEIRSGTECDALLSESMDLQYGGNRE